MGAQCCKSMVSLQAIRTSPPPALGLVSVLGPAANLAAALGVTRTLGEWLTQCGHADVQKTQRFLNPRLAELSNPDAMADRGIAAERLARAVRVGEQIAVFGDYDCDGMTSAAILTEILRELGGRVKPLLASRFDGGYGVSAAALRRILETSCTLLVTCDCGSSDHESLAQLRGLGIDVIVVDHHLVPSEPLPALAFLNPHRPDCGFAYKGMSSCGLVLSVGAALRTELGRPLDLRRWLDLVAIGTIADVAPLNGDNRSLVRAGLRALAEGRRPGVRALMQQARMECGASLASEDVSFRLAPRLNAPGRLGAPDAALELLMASTAERAELLAAQLEQASIERKAQQERMIAEAIEEVTRERYDEGGAIVVGREGWNHGIVGIVAGRLATRYRCPVVVVGFHQGLGRGSVRGPTGSRLHDALTLCEGTLRRFGGHQAAAGVELDAARLPAFREAFSAAVARVAALHPATVRTHGARVALAAEDDPYRVLADFALLEPCGELNPAPELVIEARVLVAREVTGGHLKLELELATGRRMGAFGLNMGARAPSIVGTATVAGRLRPDRYRGGDAVELCLEEIL